MSAVWEMINCFSCLLSTFTDFLFIELCAFNEYKIPFRMFDSCYEQGNCKIVRWSRWMSV